MKLNNRLRQSIFYIFLLFLIIGCAATNVADKKGTSDKNAITDDGYVEELNSKALQHMMDGQLYLDQGDFAMAIVELQEAQRLEPNVTSTYISLSECYWHLEKPVRAMEYLDAAVEIDPNDTDVREYKAELHYRLQEFADTEKEYAKLSEIEPDNADYSLALGDLAKIQQKFEKAINHYENAYKKEENILGLELAADLAHRLGKIEKANGYYDTLLELDSLNVNYLSALSDIKVQLKQADEAVALVKKVIDIEGASIERQIQLGVLYGELGKDEEAIESFEGLLEDDSTKGTAMHFLSTIYRENEDYEKAKKYANDLMEEQPESPQGFVNRALVALEQDDPDAAIQVLNPAAADFPKEYLVQYLLGLSYHQIKNYKIAVIFLDNARQLAPHSRNVLHLLGIANDNLGNYEISDGVYKQLVETDSTDAQAFNNFAYSLVERGEKLEQSKKYAEKAIKLEPDQAAYLDTYGWILYKLGKSKDALKYIQKSLGIDGNNPEILEHLGDVYRDLKKYDKAKESYQKALELDPDNKNIIRKLSEL